MSGVSSTDFKTIDCKIILHIILTSGFFGFSLVFYTDWYISDIFRIYFSSLESPRFVHVYPYSIILELSIQIIKTSKPHLSAIDIEPVNKDCNLRPDLIDKVVAVSLVLVHS